VHVVHGDPGRRRRAILKMSSSARARAYPSHMCARFDQSKAYLNSASRSAWHGIHSDFKSYLIMMRFDIPAYKASSEKIVFAQAGEPAHANTNKNWRRESLHVIWDAAVQHILLVSTHRVCVRAIVCVWCHTSSSTSVLGRRIWASSLIIQTCLSTDP
jgi:hypothetical protein